MLFKVIIDNGEKLTSNVLSKGEFVDSLILLAIFFAAILFVKVVGAGLRIYAINRIDSRLMRDLKQKFFGHLIELSHKFHTEKKTGSLISRLSRGSRSVESITDVLLFTILPLLFRFRRKIFGK